MNYKLPTLAMGLLWLAGIGLAAAVSSQVLSQQVVGESDRVPIPGQADSPLNRSVDGQALVAQAAQRLLLLPAIEANTRQQLALFGQQTIGVGTYMQWTRPPQLMLRLDLKLQLGDQMTSLLQVSDGDSLWVRRDQGGQSQLSRVNLRKLRENASQLSHTHPDAFLSPSLWMAVGGLPALLFQLESHFQFGAATPTEFRDLPVWSVEGTWKPDLLARLLPSQQDAILAGEPPRLEELPAHLPHGVTLILGRDEVIPLFPYRVSYHRFAGPPRESSSAPPRESLLTWELFEVRVRPELTAAHFDYRPGAQEVEERTDAFLTRLHAAVGSTYRK